MFTVPSPDFSGLCFPVVSSLLSEVYKSHNVWFSVRVKSYESSSKPAHMVSLHYDRDAKERFEGNVRSIPVAEGCVTGVEAGVENYS